MKQSQVRLSGLRKIYTMPGDSIEALKGIDLDIIKGEFLSLMGPSGSGKSTIMHIMGLLDGITDGEYELEGEDVSVLTRIQRATIRNKKIGFVFQSYYLLPRLNAVENVELPLLYHRPVIHDSKRRAMEALIMVGMEHRALHLPSQLSGGQQQRIAIARALVNNPSILLADEPTGNLDEKAEKKIMKILTSLNEQGITVVVVTHNPEVGAVAKRKIYLRNGLIEKDEAC